MITFTPPRTEKGLTLREAKDLALALAYVDPALWTETATAWWERRQAKKEAL